MEDRRFFVVTLEEDEEEDFFLDERPRPVADEDDILPPSRAGGDRFLLRSPRRLPLGLTDTERDAPPAPSASGEGRESR